MVIFLRTVTTQLITHELRNSCSGTVLVDFMTQPNGHIGCYGHNGLHDFNWCNFYKGAVMAAMAIMAVMVVMAIMVMMVVVAIMASLITWSCLKGLES